MSDLKVEIAVVVLDPYDKASIAEYKGFLAEGFKLVHGVAFHDGVVYTLQKFLD